MPTKIGFWNVEHWSDNALAIAEAAELAAWIENDRVNDKISQRGHSHTPTRAVTRLRSGGGSGGKAPRANTRHQRQYTPFGRDMSREERQELAGVQAARRALKTAQYKTKKFTLARDMKILTPHLFYCEVESNHPDSQSSAANGIKTPHLLCYASYIRGASTPLNNTTIWPAHIAPDRVPLYRDITGTARGAANVRCYFWHAPSGNNGAIVHAVFTHLNTLGIPFVLFGDLNAEPAQLILQGIPAGNIVAPAGGTRISTRILDYAVTNVPARVNVRKYLNCPAPDIKNYHGSDHAFMYLDLT